MCYVVVLTAMELEYSAVPEYLRDIETVRHEPGTVFEAGSLPGRRRRPRWRLVVALRTAFMPWRHSCLRQAASDTRSRAFI